MTFVKPASVYIVGLIVRNMSNINKIWDQDTPYSLISYNRISEFVIVLGTRSLKLNYEGLRARNFTIQVLSSLFDLFIYKPSSELAEQVVLSPAFDRPIVAQP